MRRQRIHPCPSLWSVPTALLRPLHTPGAADTLTLLSGTLGSVDPQLAVLNRDRGPVPEPATGAGADNCVSVAIQDDRRGRVYHRSVSGVTGRPRESWSWWACTLPGTIHCWREFSNGGSLGPFPRFRGSAEDVRHNREEVRCRMIPLSGAVSPSCYCQFPPLSESGDYAHRESGNGCK